MPRHLLIVGGKRDHNLARLAHAAESRGFSHRLIETDHEPLPHVAWRLDRRTLTINGENFLPEETSLFIRYDVFGDQAAAQKMAFFDMIKGWAVAFPQTKLLNRNNENLEVSKLRALVLAKEAGFTTPQTRIVTSLDASLDHHNLIIKPVSGGSYTRLLADATDDVVLPCFLQERLSYPELRLFRVGKHYFAFEITSDVIDYRATTNVEMREVEMPNDLHLALERLSDRLGLDYAATDLKFNPRANNFQFLEINSMPMFTAYDDHTEGRLSDAILLHLMA